MEISSKEAPGSSKAGKDKGADSDSDSLERLDEGTDEARTQDRHRRGDDDDNDDDDDGDDDDDNDNDDEGKDKLETSPSAPLDAKSLLEPS